MKTTYLIYKQVDGTRQLVKASLKEWVAIVEENKHLPIEQRRLFEKSCFSDGEGLDCMYIEVPLDEYRRWNSDNTVAQKKRMAGTQYKQLSLDAPTTSEEVSSLHEVVPSSFDLEKYVIGRLTTSGDLLKDLKIALKAWKPWGSEILDLYMAGKRRESTHWLANYCGVSAQTARRYKREFENFIKNFLA